MRRPKHKHHSAHKWSILDSTGPGLINAKTTGEMLQFAVEHMRCRRMPRAVVFSRLLSRRRHRRLSIRFVSGAHVHRIRRINWRFHSGIHLACRWMIISLNPRPSSKTAHSDVKVTPSRHKYAITQNAKYNQFESSNHCLFLAIRSHTKSIRPSDLSCWFAINGCVVLYCNP